MTEVIQKDAQEEPVSSMLITTVEALKVISDPLRLKILDLLGKDAKTVKQVAAELKTSSTKLYYHISLLEEHGFIRVVRTNVVSGIIEKHYQVAAYEIRVDRALLSVGGPDGDASAVGLLSTMLDGTQDDILASLRAGLIQTDSDAESHRTLRMGRMYTYWTPEKAEAFFNRLTDLQREFTSEDDTQEREGAQLYGFTFAMFPMLDSLASLTREDEP